MNSQQEQSEAWDQVEPRARLPSPLPLSPSFPSSQQRPQWHQGDQLRKSLIVENIRTRAGQSLWGSHPFNWAISSVTPILLASSLGSGVTGPRPLRLELLQMARWRGQPLDP